MKLNKIILAFTGQISSGKDTACKYFVERYNASLIKFSQSLRDILDRLYLEQTRENMQGMSQVLREHFGQDLLARVVAREAERADVDLVVVDGVRRPVDVRYLRELPGFYLVAIDAPDTVRFERITKRTENPDDKTKTWKQFLKDQAAEADALIPDVMKDAKFRIDNSGTAAALYKQLDELHSKLRYES